MDDRKELKLQGGPLAPAVDLASTPSGSRPAVRSQAGQPPEREQSAPVAKPITEMRGAKILIEALVREGVDTIFGYPGGATSGTLTLTDPSPSGVPQDLEP